MWALRRSDAYRIRKQITEWQRNGEIPLDVRADVQTRASVEGTTIDVTLTGWNSEAIWGPEEEGQPNLTPAARRVVSKIDVIRRSCDGETTWGVTPWTE
jgi:hypothetical protein